MMPKLVPKSVRLPLIVDSEPENSDESDVEVVTMPELVAPQRMSMKDARVSCNITEITFNPKISNISKLKQFLLPGFVVQDIKWVVLISRQTLLYESFLSFELHPVVRDKPLNWMHAAAMTIKLSNDIGESLTLQCKPFVFSKRSDIVRHNLISWKDLFGKNKNYVKNDEINLEIKIEMEDSDENVRSEMKIKCIEENGGLGIFQLEIANIDHLLAIRSPEVKIQDIPWTLEAYKSATSHLEVALKCGATPKKLPSIVEMSLKLVSTQKDVNSIEKKVEGRLSNSFSVNEFMPWNELMKAENGFVKDNSIELQVCIKLEEQERASAAQVGNGSKRLKIECAICFEDIYEQQMSSTKCGHLFCSVCITDSIRKHKVCPMCKAPNTLEDLRRTFWPISN